MSTKNTESESGRWKEEWERQAKAEREWYDNRPVTDLLEDIRIRKFGDYYNIWYSISARSTLKESGWALIDVLEHRSYDYLYRYHAAAALIYLMDSNRWQPTELSADQAEGFTERLREFKREVMGQIMRAV